MGCSVSASMVVTNKTYFPELNGALSIRQVDGRFVRHGELNSKLQLPDLI
jgi:hypothetical protein